MIVLKQIVRFKTAKERYFSKLREKTAVKRAEAHKFVGECLLEKE